MISQRRNSAKRTRVVILDEDPIDADRRISVRPKCLEKEATRIGVDVRRDQLRKGAYAVSSPRDELLKVGLVLIGNGVPGVVRHHPFFGQRAKSLDRRRLRN